MEPPLNSISHLIRTPLRKPIQCLTLARAAQPGWPPGSAGQSGHGRKRSAAQEALRGGRGCPSGSGSDTRTGPQQLPQSRPGAHTPAPPPALRFRVLLAPPGAEMGSPLGSLAAAEWPGEQGRPPVALSPPSVKAQTCVRTQPFPGSTCICHPFLNEPHLSTIDHSYHSIIKTNILQISYVPAFPHVQFYLCLFFIVLLH